MLMLSLLLLFFSSCVAGWLLCFPEGRGAALRAAAEWGRRLRPRGWRRAALLLGGAALLAIPPLLAYVASGRRALPGFDGAQRVANAQVEQLLAGERLAPPQPLPPLVFTTAEATLQRPMLASASRNWRLLEPGFEQRLLLVFRDMRERHGYEMVLLEGYRSPERQDMLAAAGPGVTGAKAFQSYHQFGLAADCAFLREGRLVISEKDPWAMRGYQLYGAAAEAAGLHWGGRWAMLDFGHVELRAGGRPGAGR
ncbi:M15 family metallopeptidase [Pseudoduganella namucuonensis]|uniref:Peptidoglycan L-alanyl-D-glutamate endopeptidase CwlK n=1 Tax=Pseudoduganella namucuonensis TaxID=1035707 RepID=A0A1I7JRA1_9BURK|nr:M15 family metallopeptidase [Pseudoduganella namucuonensis]SFU87660.1 peptidoglycan L-alanyl-D-glutamate endopeptidase CwlK [Pseudoduganella namucuonensis]